MNSEKVICGACGLFCGFLLRDGDKLTPPAFPDACPRLKGGSWYRGSTRVDECPVASMIEEIKPGSFYELRLPPRGPLQPGRSVHSGIEKDPDAFKRSEPD